MENQNTEFNNMPAGTEKPAKTFSPKDFWLGAVVGLLCTALLALICVGLYMTLGDGAKLPGVSQSSGTLESNLTGISEYYGTESILDEETAKKLDDIAALFEIYSIYDIENEDLQRGIIDGLVAGSGDKYAEYYTA